MRNSCVIARSTFALLSVNSATKQSPSYKTKVRSLGHIGGGLLRRSLRSLLAMTLLLASSKTFADTTTVANDSALKPFVPPDSGPLGIDHLTGLALYGAAILFAVLIIALWRKSIMKK